LSSFIAAFLANSRKRATNSTIAELNIGHVAQVREDFLLLAQASRMVSRSTTAAFAGDASVIR